MKLIDFNPAALLEPTECCLCPGCKHNTLELILNGRIEINQEFIRTAKTYGDRVYRDVIKAIILAKINREFAND